MKPCNVCKIVKPLEEFGKKKRAPGGIDWTCKACNRARARDHYHRDIESSRERALARYYQDRTKIIARVRMWQQKNKEHFEAYRMSEGYREGRRIYGRNYYWNNKSVCRAKNALWFRANVHRKRCYDTYHHSLRRNGVGKFTDSDISRILHAQRGRCAYCRIPIKSGYHIDHIKPVSRGGTNFPKNLQLTCKTCNLSKSASLPEDYARRRGLLI